MIAIPALGVIARLIGPEKFGLFTLAVALVGYANIFDAGLTRAVIREVSIYRNDQKEFNAIIANSTIILLATGLIGGFVIFFMCPIIVTLLNVNPLLRDETRDAISLISITIPVFLLNQVWLAIFEGQEKFKQVNIIKSINSSLLAGFPAILCLYSPSLIAAVLGLVIARVASLIITFYFCKTNIIESGLKVDGSTIRRLLSFGGWITLSNIISPVMTYMDRFIISHLSGAAKVAYYSAPSEGIQRLSILPSALSRAIFPRLSSNKDNFKNTKLLSYVLMVVSIFPVCLFIFFFSHFIMTKWMGLNFGGVSVSVLKILCVGFFFNCVAQIPFASIQARGYSKITACIHLCELIPYLLLLFFFISKWGVLGAAVSWSIRTAVDFLILYSIDFLLNNRHMK